MTNEQWLKSLDTEEFAKIYANTCVSTNHCKDFETCEDCLVDWLKQEHKE